MTRLLSYISLNLFFVLLAIRLPLLAQTATFSPVNLPPGSSSWVTDIKQDKQGYLWVSTAPGLHRYNGYEWTSFTHDPKNPASLAPDVEPVCPTRDGLVWAGTHGMGVDCLNPETGHVTHHSLTKRFETDQHENMVWVLREDHEGVLWIGTEGGLFSRDPKTGRFTHYAHNPHDPTSLSHNQVRAIYEDRQGTIWVGTGEPKITSLEEGGLNKFDRKTGRFTHYRHDPTDQNSLIDNRVRAIFEDSRGIFWVGTWGDGLHTMDRKTGTFTRHRYDPSHPERLSRPYLKNHRGEAFWGVSFIEEDESGCIWIGAYAGGLNRYDPRAGKVTHYEAGQGVASVDNNQWSACRTRDGVLWFGAATNQLIKTVPIHIPTPFISTPSVVNTFFEYSPGKYWLGTNAGLLDSQLGSKADHPFFQQAVRQTTLLTDRIQTFYEDRQGNYWISTYNAGLYRYVPKSGRFTQFRHDPKRPSSLSPGPVRSTYEDRNGMLWVMTGGGLDRLNHQTDQFTHYRHNPNDSTTISSDITTFALEDHTGQLWIGTEGGGLNRMDRQTEKFSHYLQGSFIAQIREDGVGTLWVGARNINLLRYNRRQNKFQALHDPNPDTYLNGVRSFIEDNDRNLWVGAIKGLVRVNKSRDSINLFGADYGFREGRSFYDASIYKSRDGSIRLGAADGDGYYLFRPNQLMPSRLAPPPVVLSAFRIANQTVETTPDGPLAEPLTKAKTVRLTHDQNTFAFDFAVLDYRHPEQVQYSFFMQNYEPTWRPAGTERTASYYNVPPGEYLFRVKAGSSDGGWTEKVISVIISPPWWRTWWAYTLFTLLAAGAVWSFIQYRSRALRKENRLLEEKVALRTNQLEHKSNELESSLDHLKTTQAQLIHSEKMASLGELTAGIAHEIQNPLNFVNNFSLVSTELINELQEEEAKAERDPKLIRELLDDLTQNLVKINHHGSRASSIVKGMLEHSRTSTGEYRPTDLNALADEYLHLAYQGWRAKNKEFNCELVMDFGSAISKVNMVGQDIGRVLLNLFNNAFYAVQEMQKTAPGDYRPKITVSTRQINNQVEVRVVDNGTGIPETVKAKIFQPFYTTKPTGQGTGLGLSLSYDIVTKGHKGTLAVETIQGEGTTFLVKLPIN